MIHVINEKQFSMIKIYFKRKNPKRENSSISKFSSWRDENLENIELIRLCLTHELVLSFWVKRNKERYEINPHAHYASDNRRETKFPIILWARFIRV